MILLKSCVVGSLDDRTAWVKDISHLELFKVVDNYLQME